MVAIGIPYFSIIASSLIKLRGYGLAPGNFTLAALRRAVHDGQESERHRKQPLSGRVFCLHLLGARHACCVWQCAAAKDAWERLWKAVSMLPEMLPAIVLVIGIMLFWNAIYKVIPLYNTMGIMVLAYVVLYLPYTVQYVTSSFTQINDSLLQAGRTFGGSPFYVFRRVTLPMISRGSPGGLDDDFHYCFP